MQKISFQDNIQNILKSNPNDNRIKIFFPILVELWKELNRTTEGTDNYSVDVAMKEILAKSCANQSVVYEHLRWVQGFQQKMEETKNHIHSLVEMYKDSSSYFSSIY